MKKSVPFDFVLEWLDELSPRTNPMFGCTAVYVDDKIVFILRDRGDSPSDDGVWIATTMDHHASLRAEMPSMRSIEVFGRDGPTGWQVLPMSSADFEASVRHAVDLVLNGDDRIGKVPKSRLRSAKEKSAKETIARKKATKKVAKKKQAGSRKKPARQTPKSSKSRKH